MTTPDVPPRIITVDVTERTNRFRDAYVPRLAGARAYKGSHGGKIGIVGGSSTYSGAPYFAARATTQCGADLTHVFTSEKCAPVIKGYGGDVVVHASWEDGARETFDAERAKARGGTDLRAWTSRMDGFVFGPGLGDCSPFFNAENGVAVGEEYLVSASSGGAPTVVDADGLRVFTSSRAETSTPSSGGGGDFGFGSGFVIATPNKMELFRMLRAVNPERYASVTDVDLESEDGVRRAGVDLRRYAPVAILAKSSTDVLFMDDECIRIHCHGAPKRSGGQGDVLAGVLALFLVWAERARAADDDDDDDIRRDARIAAIVSACSIVRKTANDAYTDLGRSMQASDVLNRLGVAFRRELDPDFANPAVRSS